MRTRTVLTAATLLAVGSALPWFPSSGPWETVTAQEKKASPADPPAAGTPTVLPRPDFRFPGNVGRTILDSDKPQFPQPVQPPKGALR